MHTFQSKFYIIQNSSNWLFSPAVSLKWDLNTPIIISKNDSRWRQSIGKKKWKFPSVNFGTLISIFVALFMTGFPINSQVNERLLKVYCKFLQVFAPCIPQTCFTMIQIEAYFYLLCSQYFNRIILFWQKKFLYN